MPPRLRQLLIAAVTFIGGLYFFLEFLLPEEMYGIRFGAYHEQIVRGVQVVGVMAIGLGLINIFSVHGSAIFRQRKGWPNSIVLILGLMVTLGVEVSGVIRGEELLSRRAEIDALGRYLRESPPEKVVERRRQVQERIEAAAPLVSQLHSRGTSTPREEAIVQGLAQALERTRGLLGQDRSETIASETTVVLSALAGAYYEGAMLLEADSTQAKTSRLIKESFFVSLGSAMFALLAFYIASAAYRSFRVRSFEALVMMIAAIIVILGQIPHGPLYISDDLPQIRLWLLNYVSTPAFRAIFFGSMVAALAMALRVWLSLDRGPLAADEKRGG